jgi:hypothetical protein
MWPVIVVAVILFLLYAGLIGGTILYHDTIMDKVNDFLDSQIGDDLLSSMPDPLGVF